MDFRFSTGFDNETIYYCLNRVFVCIDSLCAMMRNMNNAIFLYGHCKQIYVNVFLTVNKGPTTDPIAC